MNVAPELANCARHAPICATTVLQFSTALRFDVIKPARKLTDLAREDKDGESIEAHEKFCCIISRRVFISVGAAGGGSCARMAIRYFSIGACLAATLFIV